MSVIVCTVNLNKARRKEVKKEGREGGKKGRGEGEMERRKAEQAD